MAKYIGENALTYLFNIIKTALSGKVDTVSGKGLSTNDYTTAEKNKLAGVADNANNYSLPTASSSTLGGVKVGSGLTITGGVLSANAPDSVSWESIPDKPTSFPPATHTHEAGSVTGLSSVATSGSYADLSNKPAIPTNTSSLTNGANFQNEDQVRAIVNSAVSSVYKASGSIAFASLPTPAAANLGNVYNVTDTFTTTTSFVEGAGTVYPANTNVAIVLIGGAYKFDVLAGMLDTSHFMEDGDMVEMTNTEISAIWTDA